ncbi:MAG: bfce [Bacteroidetes bacterium]|nr:bfce [Bacteroidota bacterium]
MEKKEFEDELQQNILPFWITRTIDRQNGGFIGRISGDGIRYPDTPKGAILNARILWTFSAAYRLFEKPEYLETAIRAKEYLLSAFWDKQHGGVFWQLAADGTPLDTKKQIYAQGFAIYGLSEYARATGDAEALEKAIELYHLIEKYSLDNELNGYLEAFTGEWHEIADMRLSEKDANEKKTMNTHLHILEPYTNLYRVWPTLELKSSLKNLIELFLDKILAPSGHLQLFFDEKWINKKSILSYGHDIEASWLLYEAAVVLGEADLTERVIAVIPSIVEAASEGLQSDGSLIYETDPATGDVDSDRHWWVQAEAVVGFWYAYKLFGKEEYRIKAENCWTYIKNNLVDSVHGEWYWSIKADGSVNAMDDKAGFWKCPYHNGRMCMELITKL